MKWDVCWSRNHKHLSQTFTEKPEYLRDIEGNTSEINFYDHGIQLTRRFRALKFYMSIKTFGLKEFRKAITYNIELAEEVENHLRGSQDWEVIFPATLAVINFRYHPSGKNTPKNNWTKSTNTFLNRWFLPEKPCWSPPCYMDKWYCECA